MIAKLNLMRLTGMLYPRMVMTRIALLTPIGILLAMAPRTMLRTLAMALVMMMMIL